MNCYRFPSCAKFRSLAAAEGLLTADDKLITASHTFAIDEVGVITKGGEYDPDTCAPIVAPTVLSGWHVNYIGEPPEAWQQYLVVVNTPNRVFFGVDAQTDADEVVA